MNMVSSNMMEVDGMDTMKEHFHPLWFARKWENHSVNGRHTPLSFKLQYFVKILCTTH
jgi:hypothetical protein